MRSKSKKRLKIADLKLSKPFFSIIFPIYNRQSYLKEALDSIALQNFQDFELIAIDDGSEDRSVEILQESSGSFPSFLLLTQDHLGVSEARNTGIKHARGEYLCFVDSDDLIPPCYLQDFYSVILQTQAKVLKNTSMIKFHSTPPTPNPSPIRNIQDFKLQAQNIKLGGTIWSYCIQREFLSSLSLYFLPHRIMEDEAFIFMLLPLCEKIVLFEGSPYLYRQHSQSIVANAKVAFDRIENFKDIIEWYQAKNLLGVCPIPFYILYDVSINNPHYLEYLQASQTTLRQLPLTPYLTQDSLANALYHLPIKDFVREHQKSRGKLKYYLRRLFGLL